MYQFYTKEPEHISMSGDLGCNNSKLVPVVPKQGGDEICERLYNWDHSNGMQVQVEGVLKLDKLMHFLCCWTYPFQARIVRIPCNNWYSKVESIEKML